MIDEAERLKSFSARGNLFRLHRSPVVLKIATFIIYKFCVVLSTEYLNSNFSDHVAAELLRGPGLQLARLTRNLLLQSEDTGILLGGKKRYLHQQKNRERPEKPSLEDISIPIFDE